MPRSGTPQVVRGFKVEYVRADQLEGAVLSTLTQTDTLIDALLDGLNDAGPFGTGYRQAMADLREQLRLRFGRR